MTKMTKITEQTVKLDRPFCDVRFDRCFLDYDGSRPMQLTEFIMDDCKIVLTGAAKNTVEALRALYVLDERTREAVEGVIAFIKAPPVANKN